MKQYWRGSFVAAVALLCVVGTSTKTEAAFFAAICNDMTCSGGDDFIVQDNGSGDTIGMAGAINFTTAAFGYNLLVNTSQSKPVIGSASAPQLDLSYTASTPVGSAGGTVFLYASDTDFTGAGSFLLAMGGTHSGGSGSVTGRAWGGTSNTALQFSGSNLLGTVGPLGGASYSGATSGVLAPVVNPYSLTIGVAINRTTPGTTTGDLNLSVPEPASMALFGLGLMGVAAARRRRRAQ